MFKVTGVFAALLVSNFAVGATAPPSAPRPSIADFAYSSPIGAPQLSPDGKLIAARFWRGDESSLLLIDPDKPDAPERSIELGKTRVSNITWAGSERLLLTVIKEMDFMGLKLPVSRLLIVDLVTRQTRVADPKSRGLLAGDVLYADPTGRTALVASQDGIDVSPSVKLVDLATGAAAEVEKAKDGVWNWFADSDGVLRAGIAYDERSFKLFYRDKAGEPLRVIRGKFDKNSDASVERLTFGMAGKGTIITNERSGRFAVYEYDFNSGTVGAPLFEHPQVDVTGVWADRWSGSVDGVEYEDDRTRFHWLDARLKSLQQKLDRALPDKVNEIVSRSRSSDRYLIHSRSATDPGTWYVLDGKSQKMGAVLTPNERIDPAEMRAVRSLTFQARDGLPIPAYLTLPGGGSGKNLPLIVMPHGGPFARDSWTYDPFVQFLASRGYAVFQPQFRGSTGYGKAFVEKGYGQWGRGMQDDLDDGLDKLVRDGIVDPKRVCIVGASYGGYAALWGAIRNPDRYRCAVSLAGVTDIDAQLRANRKSFTATRYFRSWRTKVAGEQKIDLASVSPLTHAGRLRIPVLIAHGEKDEVVSVKQGRQMDAALRKAKADVTSAFYPEADHGFGRAADLEDFLKRLEAFLAKHNPA